VVWWEMQTAVNAHGDVVDVSKGAQGQHEHRTMDGTRRLGVRRGMRMSQGGKRGREGELRDHSHIQG
jgi:hypothetical protein